MGTTAEKLTYLNTTKAQIKDGINRLGGELTNLDTFREYKEALDNIYDKLPKVTGTGSDLSLSPTLQAKMQILPIGNAEQNGTPTPNNPIDVKVVTGENQVVVCNKNLLDKSYVLIGYTISNNTGELILYDTNSAGENYIPVLPNTSYTFSVNTNVNNIRLSEYQIDKTHIKRNNKENSNYVTITTTANTYFIRWSLNYDNTRMTQAIVDSLNLQIEKGTVATSYIEHQEQSYTLHLGSLELCKIGDYQDVILGTKDTWKVVRQIGKHIFTGNENWSRRNINNYGISTYSLDLANIFTYLYINGTTSLMNNNIYYKTVANVNEMYNLDYMCFSLYYKYETTTTPYIYVNYNDADLSHFKSMIQNSVIYYQLATPTEETITDTTLINELNELQELLSYDGTTNIAITSESDNAQMLVQVSALKGE